MTSFWENGQKPHFWSFYNIFTGMPKACQIFPAQTTYAKSLSLLASIILQKIKRILWPVFEKIAKNLIFGRFWPYLGMPKVCKIFFQNSGSVSHQMLDPLIFMQNFKKILWPVSEKTSGMMDGRTDRQTDKGHFIGPSLRKSKNKIW